jgi:hypothetical protein
MQHIFEAHTRNTDDLNESVLGNDDRRDRNDRRGQADRRKKDRRGTADVSHLPLLTQDEIAALLNGAR